MANFRPLTLQSGTVTAQQNADTLIAGAGVTTASGNLTISAAGSNVVVSTALQIAANVNMSCASGTTAVDFSAGSGTFKTTTGAFTIGAANGASSISTSSGALTITSAAGATWSTSAGALTITSAAAATWSTGAGVLTLNGTGGTTLQGGGTSALVINSSGTTLTIQAGATLTTTSTGQINLPLNFQINSASVSNNVTAANLGTLTAGSTSNADALHTHTNVTSSQVSVSGLTTTGVTTGLCGYFSAASTVSKTDNAAMSTSRFAGVNTGTSGSLQVAGLVTVAFTTAGGSPSNGSPVFLAAAGDDTNTGAGKLTATCPTTGCVEEVGLCADNGNYASAKTAIVLLQCKSPVQL